VGRQKESVVKVKLLSYTKEPEAVVAAAIRQCYSQLGSGELKKKLDKETQGRLINQVMASGHTSTLEHASFSFGVEGISRITETQLVRHRIASYSVQSGRYVKRADVKYTIPLVILKNKKLIGKYKKYLKNANDFYNELISMGVAVEDARYCQPQSLQTKVVVTMNARSLLHFFELRCCQRAQWEIREMALKMLFEVKKVAPLIFAKAGSSCLSQKICWEGDKSCGKWKNIKEAELRTRV
jgi:thymidylate synthase (FAD)